MRRIVCLITLLLLIRPAFGAATTGPTSAIQKLIDDLADPDPSTRQHAAEKLVAIGDPARAELVQAARSDSPQIASRAAEVLMKLPWYAKSDPDDVRDKLAKYGAANNDDRKELIKQIVQDEGCEPALLRLARDDPSDTVSWFAVAALRLLEDEKTNRVLREMDLTDARVQIVALAARAFLPVDHARGIALLRRAIDQDTEDSGSDDANLDFAYRVLITDALSGGDENEALRLQRLRVHRSASSGDASDAVFELVALYADHGITDTLEQDLQEDAEYLGRPEVMYALARLEPSRADGSALMKDAINQCALAASLTSAESHLRVGGIMQELAWDEQAWMEFYSILSIKDPHPDAERLVSYCWAHKALAEIAEVNEDHAASADHWEVVLPDAQALSGVLDLEPTVIKNEITWHRLHAARDAHDAVTTEKLLNQLLEIPTPNTSVAIEVVDTLKSQGRRHEALAYFQKAYQLQNDRLAMRLKMANNLNEFAWVCARCGERADEAVKMAQRAMAIEPENYAYIDTAASAYFASGDVARAIEFEKRALTMRPADQFMGRQLVRFQESKKGKP